VDAYLFENLAKMGLEVFAYAAPVVGTAGVGVREHELVTPASVMKIQVALAVESLIDEGVVQATDRRIMLPTSRTPGPVGMSLMRDEVVMSVRDLIVAMLTISDNVATDELIDVAGLDYVNLFTQELGLERTWIASNLQQMLDDVAREAGFSQYKDLADHDPERDGPPAWGEVGMRIESSRALNPTLGSRTTPHETVTLLQALWTDRAKTSRACAAVRHQMSNQLVRTRIASGFDSSVTVAAKSGALLKVVRNEVGVVSFLDGSAFAVAVFTRQHHYNEVDAVQVDAAIGQVARSLVEELYNA
jgi:beta-lactamase class A